MKLNQLTIHNIASIKDATIRFDAQPLSSSEVFLITGKTGAGKSTILDAICLALYADTPRLDSTNMQGNMADQEKVVKVDDPRQLMRRNTGEAFVQLTFKGANGVSYEATWSVARSRNKPDGNLQAKKWTLKNMLSDITYNRDEEIKAEIRKAIGLDFKQFCRTTMLAQGEFTRFLNSKDDDKADILEKITGASIYSRIGKRIFDMTKEHKEEWLQEEQKIEANKPMSDDEVAAKKAEIVRLDKEREANNTLVQQEQTKAAWLTKEQELAQKTTEAKTSLARIEQQIGGDEFRKDDLLLQLWQSTTEARGWAVDRQAALSSKEKLLKEMKKMQADYLQLHAALDFSVQEAERNARRISELTAALNKEAGRKPLYENMQGITSQLQLMLDSSRKERETQMQMERTTQTLNQQLIPKHEEAKKKLAEGAQKLEAQSKRIGTEEAALEQLQLPAKRQQSEEMSALKRNICSAREAVSHCADELRRDWELRRNLQETATQITQKRQEAEAMKPKVLAAEQVVQTLQETFQMEQEKVSDWAKRMRVKLHVGDVCPVCQRTIETELPHEQALAELVAISEQKLKQAMTARDTLLQARQAAEADIKALENSLTIQRKALSDSEALVRAKERTTQAISDCMFDKYAQMLNIEIQSLEQSIEQWNILLSSASNDEKAIPADIKRHADSLLGELDSWEEKTEVRCVALRQEIAAAERQELEVKKLRKEQEALRTTQDRLMAEMQEAEKRVIKAQNDLNATGAIQKAEKENYGRAKRQVAALMGESFDAQAWRCNWEESPAEFISELRGATLSFNKDTEELRNRQQEQEKMSERQANLEAVLRSIGQLVPEWEQGEQAAQPFTPPFRPTLIMQQANSLLSNVSSTQELISQNTARMSETEQLLHSYIEQHPTEMSGIMQVCGVPESSTPPTFDEQIACINRLANKDPQSIELTKMRVESVKQHHIKLIALQQEAVKQQESHLLLKPKMEQEETLEAVLLHTKELTAKGEEQNKQKGAVLRDLELDNEVRKKTMELREKANRLNLLYQRWDRLNQLLGDATGGKFRKIAQSYVLSNLLHAANGYLRSLTDRYTLHVRPGSFAISLSDAYQGYTLRAATTLSGGESFLVSLALALALSDIDSHLSVDTLFIDEGFGTLSGEALQNAVSTLRSLHAKAGRHVGIISHVKELKECIPVQICVEQEGYNSSSQVKVEVVL